MTKKARLIKYDELEKLLSLYEYLNLDDPKLEMNYDLRKLWNEIMSDSSLFYLVIDKDELFISSCTLAIIKNLTRSARPYGLIENVVTHPDYRKKGYGTTVLDKAVEIAEEKNCYKVMLMTSKKDESVLRFYEKAGFESGKKTAFIVRL
jgi:ribosomal protein S18 acetylase RimI-like enzyme